MKFPRSKERTNDSRLQAPGRKPGARSLKPDAEADQFVVFVVFSQSGCTNAPSPAESHAANRTHAFPVASNGIENFFAPNAPVSVAEIIWRSIFLPSPHTTSTKDSG